MYNWRKLSAEKKLVDLIHSVPWMHLAGCDIREMTRQGVARLLADGVRNLAILSAFPANDPSTAGTW